METKKLLTEKFDYLKLDQGKKTVVEYVWIGGTGLDLRSKAKTYEKEILTVEDLDEWNYDGSSTYQAPTNNSEVLLRPVALFLDPFRLAPNKIALCEAYTVDGKPVNSNFRHFCKKIFDKGFKEFEPWFGIEQEYTLMNCIGNDVSWPYGWPFGSYPKPQGQYYCSVGARNSYGREITNAHYKACLYAGVKIYGTNAEVMPGQWEFQIGTCHGIEIGDHLWMGRYLLIRVAEMFGLDVSFDPKPISGDWNGSGGHLNYSDKLSRNDNKLESIKKQMKKLEDTHNRLIKLYGENNELRLTGKHETSSIAKFSYGIANRGSSVRIPRTTELTGNGYWEDRRPAANVDPYLASAALFSVACLDNYGLDDIEGHYLDFAAKRNNTH